MGNKTGSVRKLDNDSDSDNEQTAAKGATARKTVQSGKGCDTEPTSRRRSSGGNGDSSSSSIATLSKKKTNSILSEHQKQLISRSWRQHVNRHSSENIGVRILFHVFEHSPEIKHFFSFDDTSRENLLFDKRFQKQAKAFVRVIDDAIRDIENLEDEVQKRLHGLGARHVKFRSAQIGAFKMQHWDTFAEAMLEAIIDSQRGVHKYRDATATWRIFITWLVGMMKQGYYDALRAERRATSVGLPPPQPPLDPSPNPRPFLSTTAVSASGPSSASASVSSYARNHSVCYGHSDLVRQFQQTPPSSMSPASFSQRFLEPAAVTARSAPHSPYVIKPQPRQTSPRAAPEVVTSLHVAHEPHPKRSLASGISAAGHHHPTTSYVRDDRTSHRRNYEYAEENDAEYEDVRSQDENYPSGHYYSDYY